MCIHHCMFVTGLSWRQAMESSQKLVGLVPCPGHDMSPKASGKDSRRKSSSWVNYNDLTSRPSPGIMVFIGEIIPKWPNNSGEWIILIYPDHCSYVNHRTQWAISIAM